MAIKGVRAAEAALARLVAAPAGQRAVDRRALRALLDFPLWKSLVDAGLPGDRVPFVIEEKCDMKENSDRLYTLAADEGDAIWFLGALTHLKATGAQTEGRFELLDQRMPGGYAVPVHVHHRQDEAWYLLEGTMTFHCGDRAIAASAGSWVFGPRDVAHTFVVGPEGARALTFSFPAGFAEFVSAIGTPAAALETPPPAAVDEARLSRVAAEFGIDIIAPPPH